MNPVITDTTTGTAQRKTGLALTVVTTVFFMWGFVTVLNDILVPHLKALFELNYTQTMLIQFTFFSAYFLMSVPSSRILARVGYQKSIVLGLAVMGLGALLFYPAAAAKSYALFLGALWVLASGITLLQVAANPYVAQLGAPAKASSRLNLAQAFNSLGTTIAPYLGGLLILSETAGHADARAVQLPYIGIALTLFLLAFGVSRFHLPSLPDIEEGRGVLAGDSIWQHRHLVLGAIGIFLYVGAEVSIGSFLVNYFSQPDIGGLTERAAAGYVSFYWGGAMVGRFIGSAVLRATPPGKVLGGAAILASALVWISVATTGGVAMGRSWRSSAARSSPYCKAHWPIPSAYTWRSSCRLSAISTSCTTALSDRESRECGDAQVAYRRAVPSPSLHRSGFQGALFARLRTEHLVAAPGPAPPTRFRIGDTP
jgi:FHS family L-fucose permease-like MFS transporter